MISAQVRILCSRW